MKLVQLFYGGVVALLLTITGCGGGGGGEVLAGTLQFSASSYSGTEDTSGQVVTVTVSRTGGSAGDVSVGYATADDSATADNDYTATAGTLSWTDGDSVDKTFQVQLTDDAGLELGEQLTVALSNVVGADLGSVNTASIRIADNDSVTISGIVSAPSGSLAFNGPTWGQQMFAALFGRQTLAAIGDLVSPVASVAVEVLEVDATGSTVGSAITSGSTDGLGEYTLAAPLDAPNGKYIVRATGTSGVLDARITSATVDVDPATDAVSTLVISIASNLASLTTAEINQIHTEVENLLTDIDTSGTASTLSANLVSAAQVNTGINNTIASKAAAGQICGTASKDSGATALQSIRITVRDFVSWRSRARTRTATDGSYCVNVPVGNYIVAALNRTGTGLDADRSASEWWTASGGAPKRRDAESIAVIDTTPVTVDFDLAAGARIQGTVSTFDAGSAEGVRVVVLDYVTFDPVMAARVKADGSYRVNVAPGDYLILVRNRTTGAYASQFYNAPVTYNNNRNAADIYSIAAGVTDTIDFTLEAGQRVSGQVLDAPAGSAVAGQLVTISLSDTSPVRGSAIRRLHTDQQGRYRLWLKPDSYLVRARGQSTSVDLTAASADTTDFTTNVGARTLVVTEGNAIPVRNAQAILYSVDTTNPVRYSYNIIERTFSLGDGTTALYAPAGNYKLLLRIGGDRPYASMVYISDGFVTAINAGDDVAFVDGATSALGTIVLPTEGVGNGAGILKGIAPAVSDSAGILGGQFVELRSGTTNNTTRFFTRRTLGDGSYTVSTPVGSYTRLRIDSKNVNTTATVDITDGGVTSGQN